MNTFTVTDAIKSIEDEVMFPAWSKGEPIDVLRMTRQKADNYRGSWIKPYHGQDCWHGAFGPQSVPPDYRLPVIEYVDEPIDKPIAVQQ